MRGPDRLLVLGWHLEVVQTRGALVPPTATRFRIDILILRQHVLETPLLFLPTRGVAPVHPQGFEGQPRLGWDMCSQMLPRMKPTTKPEGVRPEKGNGFAQAGGPIRRHRHQCPHATLELGGEAFSYHAYSTGEGPLVLPVFYRDLKT